MHRCFQFFKYELRVHERDLVFLNKTMPQAKIDQGISDFNNGRDSDDHNPRLLIATTATFGLGQTLNKAIALSLLEPDYRLHAILQVMRRHTRQGNPNKRTWSWMFRTRNNGVEARITDVNIKRARIDETIESKVGDSRA